MCNIHLKLVLSNLVHVHNEGNLNQLKISVRLDLLRPDFLASLPCICLVLTLNIGAKFAKSITESKVKVDHTHYVYINIH